MDRGLYQRKVAEEIGVDPTTIRNWELGHTEPALRYWPAAIGSLGFVPFEVGESSGARIRAWRKLNGVARSELADRLGVDESTVWRREVEEATANLQMRDRTEPLLADLPSPR